MAKRVTTACVLGIASMSVGGSEGSAFVPSIVRQHVGVQRTTTTARTTTTSRSMILFDGWTPADMANGALFGVELAIAGAAVPLLLQAREANLRRSEEAEAERRVMEDVERSHARVKMVEDERRKVNEERRAERRLKVQQSIAAARAEEERVRKNKDEAIRLAEEKALKKKAEEEAAAAAAATPSVVSPVAGTVSDAGSDVAVEVSTSTSTVAATMEDEDKEEETLSPNLRP